MKYSLTLATIIAMAGGTYSQAEDVLPPQYNFDRYSKMVDQSPFAVATAVKLNAVLSRSEGTTSHENHRHPPLTREDGAGRAGRRW